MGDLHAPLTSTTQIGCSNGGTVDAERGSAKMFADKKDERLTNGFIEPLFRNIVAVYPCKHGFLRESNRRR